MEDEYQKVGNDFFHNLEIPQQEGKQGYIGTLFTMYLKLASILQSPEFQENPLRVYYIALEMISLIPEPDLRKKIQENIKIRRIELINQYKNEGRIINDSVSDHIMTTATLETLGEITDYVDRHIGLSMKNKIGFIARKNKEIYINGEKYE